MPSVRLLHRLLGLALAASACSVAAADVDSLTATCAACHGADGNSVNPQWPNLAGQHASYLLRQLRAFKSGERQNPAMAPIIAPLSDDDLKALAEHYAALPRRLGQADRKLVPLGQSVYRGGNAARGLPGCIGCHEPTGAGNPPAAYPALAGQHAEYLQLQLRAYRDGSRRTDPNQVMRTIARRMTDAEIEAVASYAEGLHDQAGNRRVRSASHR